MEIFKNKIEDLTEKINSVIKDSRIEEKNLSDEIKIWWYKITDTYDWFLESWEKWFAIIISESENDDNAVDLWIIVKYEEWKITIRDTQQGTFDDESYNEITLEPDEQISWNDDVNKINKLIKGLWYNTITGEDLNKLAEKIEQLKK